MAENIAGRISNLVLSRDETPSEDVLTASPYSEDPQKAWAELGKQLTVDKVEPLPLNTPVRDNAVRFVCISDTHDKLNELMKEPRKGVERKGIPPGDVLLHAGDFTFLGTAGRVQKFNEILGMYNNFHQPFIHQLSMS